MCVVGWSWRDFEGAGIGAGTSKTRRHGDSAEEDEVSGKSAMKHDCCSLSSRSSGSSRAKHKI